MLILGWMTGGDMEALGQFSDSTPYYAGLSASGIYNRTNTSRYYLLNNGISLSARRKDLRYNALGKWLYGRQNEQLSNNDVLSTIDVDLYKTLPHFYYWGLFNYTSSYSLRIRTQLQAGLGGAYNIIDCKNTTLNISEGLLYEYSDIILEDSSIQKYSTPRNSLRIKVRLGIGKVLSFSGTGFYQPSLEYAHDYIIRSDLSLGLKILKWFSLTTSLTYNEMSRTGTRNLFFSYGLTIEQYF